ncbi:MAG TPA: alpha/beta fold hydrolase, partial [Ilumatobacteraceae bacterium]
MRNGHRRSALLALLILAACGTNANVHSSRADPIDSTATSGAPATTAPVDSTPSTDAPATTEPTNNGTLDWQTCDDPSVTDSTLECATLTVPLDYDNPSGDTIDMALIRVPATGDRKGAILFNPGGPGASTFDYVAAGGTTYTGALGTQDFDFVGFDPRGVERSNGIHCVTDEFLDRHLYIDGTPDTPEEQTLKDESEHGFVDACKAKYGDKLRFYSTVNTARDMDAIRVAMGDDQISYLGISYGTYLGATYATMFPDRVRAMVLDSVLESNGDTTKQSLETQLVGFEGAFQNWATWCQGDATCAFTTADVPARWDALKQKLDDTPITDTNGRVGNNATMERATIAALYSESDWPVLANALADAEGGDPKGILSIADSYNGRNDDGTFTTLFQSFPVISCASGLEPPLADDPEGLATELRAEAPRFAKDLTAADVTFETTQCDGIAPNVKPLALSYSGDGPIVLVGGTNDPATPIRWARKMLDELGPNARLVTSTGEGHGQLLANNCVTDIEGALLEDLTVPDADTVCEPDPLIAKPDWWDALPVPDGVSGVVQLPELATAVGAEPSVVFSEMRTTSASAKDVVAAYTESFKGAGLNEFDAPSTIPVDDTAQGTYTDGSKRAVVVIALGPKAFDDPELQRAKDEIPPNTTV